MAPPLVQLFCLPYSGASATIYHRWRPKVPSWLSIHPVELPGRGARFGEALVTDMHALALHLAQMIAHQHFQQKRQPELPYALFGHSMGGLLAFEVMHALRELDCPKPLALFASAAAAPTQRKDRERGFATPKSDIELIENLRDFQGTPAAVLANTELMDLTLPVLRADFLLCGHYQYRQRAALDCSIHVLAGKDDAVNTEQLIAWESETTGSFSLDNVAGGHFFIHEHEPAVLQAIYTHLANDLQGGVARQLAQ